ncbi:alkene reductase [Glaciimonas immobilis]|uniref:N-ethylmaleimide reductase n=1 Tax=Glaciimonas immobilis TaxID=728004 RepID=A0A840S177_9BURK|nr:alkene reductase [Glaciimonas immobilis]KAF3995991.1 alkene reductase [Glaciimonas immobilis]MBB5202461.1 N-ethylmaleimide reductase [Glaciimonas immobilis]
MQTNTNPTTENSNARLYESVQLGPYHLRNRIVMAPLTRSRATDGDVPSEMAILYYAQRASAGLIIAEATQISPQGKGYVFTPGIYNATQVAAWKKITDAVHAKNGRIFLQLWHVGRISHPSIQPNGELPVAPSAILPEGQAYTDAGFVPLVTPRALRLDEMPGIVNDYREAARHALAAGFDGVEIHAANGYLLDQFLRDKTNQRTDAYGGSVENRARLLVEVTAAVTEVWGGDRVGLRISPLSKFGDIWDSNPQALFTHAVEKLNAFNLAYLHVIEGDTGGEREVSGGFDLQILRNLFNGAYMANNGYDADLAEDRLDAKKADLIAFGRPFIANPDLVERMQTSAVLAEADPATMYGGDSHGYIDYPTLSGSLAT